MEDDFNYICKMQLIKKLSLDLEERSYDIVIGINLIASITQIINQRSKIFIITDSNIAKYHLAKLQLDNAHIITVEAGEQSKNFSILQKITEEILSHHPDRKTLIIAFGGGVIGDLAGFAASIILRGIDFIQIPTTLLSQVDSSVGGKTGINSTNGKNMIGSFYQPKQVIIDLDLLKTLPDREFLCGYAEVVKYGFINNLDFFNWLDENLGRILARDVDILAEAIYRSCKSKAEIVSMDEREGNIRALLNLGHTFGHAFEAETGFSNKLLHGEAVAIGMVKAFELSAMLGLCSDIDCNKVKSHLIKAGLPTDCRDFQFDSAKLLAHMQHDKKAENGKLVLILARAIGDCFIAHDIASDEVMKILNKIPKIA